MPITARKAVRILLPLLLCGLPWTPAGLAAAPSGPYPDKPVRFIIPYPAGGATDVLSRILGERLAAQLGQPVVADNRGGAAGRIGLELLAKSPPDGYTISLPSSGVAIRVGATNHITAELFQLVAGVRMSHVPYKSSAGGLTDVISGQIQMMMIGPPAAAPHVQAGRLRALAVVYNKRFSGMPEVPTTAEAGLAGVDAPTWYAIVVPAGTPKAVVTRLNREFVTMLNTAEMKRQMLLLGAEPRPQTPEESSEFMRREVDKWAKVIKAANVKPE